MKLSEGVEWAAHCALLLAALPNGSRLSGKAMAEFHGVPESYLLKNLKLLAGADILVSVSGPKGGYALKRAPKEVSLLDIVMAIEGPLPAFRCTDIRRRGPCSLDDPNAYTKPCGIMRAMHRAERDYRQALKAETLETLLADFISSVDPRIAELGTEWARQNIRT